MHPVFVYFTPFPEATGSVQLQALIPARHLGAKALYFGPDTDATSFLDQHKPDALIFTKLFTDSALTLAAEAKKRGIRLLGVFCDLHLTDQMGWRNAQLGEIADEIVVPTEYLAEILRKHLARRVIVIEEPIQLPRHAPQFSPTSELRIVWCGSPNNHDTLAPGIQELAHFRGRKISLVIVSGEMPVNLAALSTISGDITIGFMPWSLMIQREMTQLADMVFLPSFDSEEKKAKSHDRLVEAINAGRIALAYPLPQYQELADYCICSDDYASGIEAALADPEGLIKKIQRGQEYIDSRFSPEVNAIKWQNLLGDSSSRQVKISSNSQPVQP